MKLKTLLRLDRQARVSYFGSYTDTVKEFSVMDAIDSYNNIKTKISLKDATLWLGDIREGSIKQVREKDHIDECTHCHKLGRKDPLCEYLSDNYELDKKP